MPTHILPRAADIQNADLDHANNPSQEGSFPQPFAVRELAFDSLLLSVGSGGTQWLMNFHFDVLVRRHVGTGDTGWALWSLDAAGQVFC